MIAAVPEDWHTILRLGPSWHDYNNKNEMATNYQQPIFAPLTFKHTPNVMSGLKHLLEGKKQYLFLLLFKQISFLLFD